MIGVGHAKSPGSPPLPLPNFVREGFMSKQLQLNLARVRSDCGGGWPCGN